MISTFRGRYRRPRARGNEARAVTGSKDGPSPRPGTQWGLATQLLGTRRARRQVQSQLGP